MFANLFGCWLGVGRQKSKLSKSELLEPWTTMDDHGRPWKMEKLRRATLRRATLRQVQNCTWCGPAAVAVPRRSSPMRAARNHDGRLAEREHEQRQHGGHVVRRELAVHVHVVQGRRRVGVGVGGWAGGYGRTCVKVVLFVICDNCNLQIAAGGPVQIANCKNCNLQKPVHSVQL